MLKNEIIDNTKLFLPILSVSNTLALYGNVIRGKIMDEQDLSIL